MKDSIIQILKLCLFGQNDYSSFLINKGNEKCCKNGSRSRYRLNERVSFERNNIVVLHHRVVKHDHLHHELTWA